MTVSFDSVRSLTFLLCDPDGVALICALKLLRRQTPSTNIQHYGIDIWQFEPSDQRPKRSTYTKYPVLIERDNNNVDDTGLMLTMRIRSNNEFKLECAELVGCRSLPYELLRVIITRAALLLVCLFSSQYPNHVLTEYPIEDSDDITLTDNTMFNVKTLLLAMEDMQFEETANGDYTVIDSMLDRNNNVNNYNNNNDENDDDNNNNHLSTAYIPLLRVFRFMRVRLYAEEEEE